MQARLLIAGVPRAGKTTLANARGAGHGIPVRHTDDLIKSHDWSAASAKVATWFDAPGSWIIEGVAVGRALRKWLASHPTGKPADSILWMPTPRLALNQGQRTMADGCHSVWREVLPQLRARGVIVEVVR